MKEQIFKSVELHKAFSKMDGKKTWWFDTESKGEYEDTDTLDGKGVPIVWDDEKYSVKAIKSCTGANVCALVLAGKDDQKVLVLIHQDLSDVVVHMALTKTVPWKTYTKEGLFAVKKIVNSFELEAAIINPSVKTLDKMGVIEPAITEIINSTDLVGSEDSNGSPEGTDKQD